MWTENNESFFVWNQPQTGREQEKQSDFFTLSAQFPLYFLPEDPCLQNVQSMLSMDRRLSNLPEQNIYIKKGETEKNAPPPSCTAMQKDEVITQKTSLPRFFVFFSLFILVFPEHWGTIMTRILGLRTGSPLWRWEREKKRLLTAKVHWLVFRCSIMPNLCSSETAKW